MDNLIVIKKFFRRYEAEHAKGLLEEQDIESIVSADDCGGFRPHLTLGMGNVRLLVQKEDGDKAREVLQVLEGSVAESVIEEITESVKNFQPSKESSEQKNASPWPIVKLILAAVFVFPLSALAYNHFRTETHKEYYLNHRVMREWTWKGGSVNGPAKGYYEDGAVRWEGNYKDWKLEGEVKQYYKDGSLNWIVHYKDGQEDGMAKKYFPNGRPEFEGEYKNDVLIVEKEYNEQGVLIFEGKH